MSQAHDKFGNVHELLDEYVELEKELADPSIHSDQGKARRLGKRYAELGPVIAGYRSWKSATEDLAAGREMAAEDADFAAEIPALEAALEESEARLEELLLPRDPNDDRDVIMEIKAGVGGDESALFAGDLLRMYQRYAERQGWKTEIIDATDSEMGGYKDVSMAIKSRGTGEPGKTPYAKLKFEGGVHRVQRVPETESQGRIHTSACTVAILAEADEVSDVVINPAEIRIDTYRASGAGGQHINKTDSAVRITHLPTGIVVECQDDRSQHKNKAQAMSVLVARIKDAEVRAQQSKIASERKSLIGSGDRSERIRTYNYPQGRITDHRINLTLYKIDAITEGDMDELIGALSAEHQADLLASLGDDN